MNLDLRIKCLTKNSKPKTSVNVKSKPPPKPKMKKTRPPRGPDDWMYDNVLNLDEEWDSSLYNLTHIQIMPTDKIPIKKDRRVVLLLSEESLPSRQRAPPTLLLHQPRELLLSNRVLATHPFFQLMKTFNSSSISLEQVLVYLKAQSVCSHSPVFLAMASVGDELYWQLVQNFFYSLVK